MCRATISRGATVLTVALAAILTAAAFAAAGCANLVQTTAAPGNYVVQVTGAGATTNVVRSQSVNLDITK